MHQRIFRQIFQHRNHRQTADKLGDEAGLDQVSRLDVLQKVSIPLGVDNLAHAFALFLFSTAEADLPLAHSARDDPFQPDESAAADEQDVRRIHRRKFLVRMLAAALGGHIGDGAFQDLQQRLLHAFARHVARDGRVVVLAANLVDFVDVDDALLGARHIPIGILQQPQDDVLDVFADVAGFGQRGGVDNGEGHVQNAR